VGYFCPSFINSSPYFIPFRNIFNPCTFRHIRQQYIRSLAKLGSVFLSRWSEHLQWRSSKTNPSVARTSKKLRLVSNFPRCKNSRVEFAINRSTSLIYFWMEFGGRKWSWRCEKKKGEWSTLESAPMFLLFFSTSFSFSVVVLLSLQQTNMSKWLKCETQS
jgi:hypothetical protein